MGRAAPNWGGCRGRESTGPTTERATGVGRRGQPSSWSPQLSRRAGRAAGSGSPAPATKGQTVRILILGILLILLLAPGLVAAEEAPPLSLSPAAGYPAAAGQARLVATEDGLLLTIEARGLTARPARAAAAGGGPGRPVFVVWLIDATRRPVNLGTLAVDADGNGAQSLRVRDADPDALTVVVSAEPRTTVAAPSAPRDGIVLMGQFPEGGWGRRAGLARDLGPGWFTPILPAALGLMFLRGARRLAAPRAAAPPIASPAPA